ncbi:hypothetical protein TTHERM_01701350 (macronuclear) [Tetrahymena thermophila SB210]|uniref:Oxalate/formate antiporter protein n=1 Tax=Tetrahymena thermophila (strain SB210) TaxID=312017 RepID=Q227T8_TETTS|nr:hypothetical protein TTHERM_01701350 [Tetrahymena thermophila SB210]EAR81555.2 hypothetical protein TTHERM_01701350 [Tetrahymena thermophila SB210]|eukprot:XP_001029218.2 hypothetical protein TTHERM_01701350 [Tetrahymena thermophila SB210]
MLASHLYSRSSVQNGASSLPPIRFGPSLLPRRPLVTFTFLHGIFRNKGGGIGFEPPISLLRPSDSPTRAAQPFQIGDEGASGLGSALANCINLSNLALDLFRNQIGHEGASGLGSALANCINLQNLTLDLCYNQIGDEGASGLGSALANCINLQNLTLELSHNQIGDEGASGLGSALANCINLSNLTLVLWQKQFICFGL